MARLVIALALGLSSLAVLAEEPKTCGNDDCGKELAFFTMTGTKETILIKSGEAEGFTYYNMSLGPANLAPVISARHEDSTGADIYTTIRTLQFFKNWEYGYMKDGMNFNPDSFVVPKDKLVENGKPASITVQFSKPDGKTEMFVGQFVALDELPVPDLYTLVIRTYTDDAKLEQQLVKDGKHGVYDPHEPHFHTKPHAKQLSTLITKDTDLVETKYFVVELYLTPEAEYYLDPIITLPLILFSDKMLKTGIKRIGVSARGIPIYKFRYKSAEHSPSGEPTTEYIGTMAQDLVELEPSAVSVGTDGFYRVDYSKIDVDFKAVV